MSETKHAIGPVNIITAGEGYHSLLTPESEDEPHYTAIVQANDDELSARVATLFAAAPDMLRELRAILEWAKTEKAPMRDREIASIKALIAKAEGRS